MNVPRPTAQTQAISSGEDARVLSISKPSPKIIADFTREAAPAAPPSKDRDSFAVTAIADLTDRSPHAAAARLTGDFPAALARCIGLGPHLANAPGKRMCCRQGVQRRPLCQLCRALRCGGAPMLHRAPPQDKRFPATTGTGGYNFIHQAFLLNQQWWHNATTDRGISRQHENIVNSRRARSAVEFPADKSDALGHRRKGRHEPGERPENFAGIKRDISGKSRSAPRSSWSAATSP
jgi:hypothetical protein